MHRSFAGKNVNTLAARPAELLWFFAGDGKQVLCVEFEMPELNGAGRHAAEALARKIDVPPIDVANLYKAEWKQLEDGATIKSYIPVVAA